MIGRQKEGSSQSAQTVPMGRRLNWGTVFGFLALVIAVTQLVVAVQTKDEARLLAEQADQSAKYEVESALIDSDSQFAFPQSEGEQFWTYQRIALVVRNTGRSPIQILNVQAKSYREVFFDSSSPNGPPYPAYLDLMSLDYAGAVELPVPYEPSGQFFYLSSESGCAGGAPETIQPGSVAVFVGVPGPVHLGEGPLTLLGFGVQAVEESFRIYLGDNTTRDIKVNLSPGRGNKATLKALSQRIRDIATRCQTEVAPLTVDESRFTYLRLLPGGRIVERSKE